MSAEFEDVGFVISSQPRLDVLTDLGEGPATPSAISDRTEHAIAHVSRALSQMADRDLVKLLVPENVKKGRIYGLTDHGEDVLEKSADIRADGRGEESDAAPIIDQLDEDSKIKAQTRKLCELVGDPEAAYQIREGAQLAIVRRDA